MKLQKFMKDKKVKNCFLVSIVALVFVIGGITFYRTFALYQAKESFDVLVGVVPKFTKDTSNVIQEEQEVLSDEEIETNEMDKPIEESE